MSSSPVLERHGPHRLAPPLLLLLLLAAPAAAEDAPTDEAAEATAAEATAAEATAAEATAAEATAAEATVAPFDAPASEAAPPADEPPGEEITVYGEAEVKRTRAALEALIVDQGYQEGKQRDGKTIFRPEIPWKPTVVVYDEGFMELKRSPVRWMHPGKQDRPLNNLWCLPPFTPMCVRIGGQVVAESKLTPQKSKVLDEVHEQSEAWRQAIVDQATWTRVNEEVPTLVQATWDQGQPLEGDGPPLEDQAARRRALLDFWASRSDTREGDMVAQVVADFVVEEVQSSRWPVTAEELADANRAAAGKRVLQLDPGIPNPPDSATEAPPP